MAEERKSASTGSKETICIVLTLVALALVFSSALALVITLHSKDVELKRGASKDIPVLNIGEDINAMWAGEDKLNGVDSIDHHEGGAHHEGVDSRDHHEGGAHHEGVDIREHHEGGAHHEGVDIREHHEGGAHHEGVNRREHYDEGTAYEGVDSREHHDEGTHHEGVDIREQYKGGTHHEGVDSRDHHDGGAHHEGVDRREHYDEGTAYEGVDSREHHDEGTHHEGVDSREQYDEGTHHEGVDSREHYEGRRHHEGVDSREHHDEGAHYEGVDRREHHDEGTHHEGVDSREHHDEGTHHEGVDRREHHEEGTHHEGVDSREHYEGGRHHGGVDSREHHDEGAHYEGVDSREHYEGGRHHGGVDSREHHDEGAHYEGVDSREHHEEGTHHEGVDSREHYEGGRHHGGVDSREHHDEGAHYEGVDRREHLDGNMHIDERNKIKSIVENNFNKVNSLEHQNEEYYKGLHKERHQSHEQLHGNKHTFGGVFHGGLPESVPSNDEEYHMRNHENNIKSNNEAQSSSDKIQHYSNHAQYQTNKVESYVTKDKDAESVDVRSIYKDKMNYNNQREDYKSPSEHELGQGATHHTGDEDPLSTHIAEAETLKEHHDTWNHNDYSGPHQDERWKYGNQNIKKRQHTTFDDMLHTKHHKELNWDILSKLLKQASVHPESTNEYVNHNYHDRHEDKPSHNLLHETLRTSHSGDHYEDEATAVNGLIEPYDKHIDSHGHMIPSASNHHESHDHQAADIPDSLLIEKLEKENKPQLTNQELLAAASKSSRHKFDPVLYAKIGYWPFNHIEGDARQLYYAQWLKKHIDQLPGNKLSAEGIEQFLSKKLHGSYVPHHSEKVASKDPHTALLAESISRDVRDYLPFGHRNTDSIPYAPQTASRHTQSSREIRSHVAHAEHQSHLPNHHVSSIQHSPGMFGHNNANSQTNHEVDILESNSEPKTPQIHADENHHSIQNEEQDVALNPGYIDKSLSEDEIKSLFASDEHKQYNADVLGDIAKFNEFDVKKRNLSLVDASKSQNTSSDIKKSKDISPATDSVRSDHLTSSKEKHTEEDESEALGHYFHGKRVEVAGKSSHGKPRQDGNRKDTSKDVALELLKILQKYNSAKNHKTTQHLVYNHSQEELDGWLGEILDISSEPEVLSVALEMYGERKADQPPREDRPYPLTSQLLHSVRSRHKHTDSKLPPTYHLSRAHSQLTFKRQENDTFGAETGNASSVDIKTSKQEELQTATYTNNFLQDVSNVKHTLPNPKLSKSLDRVENDLLKYLITNLSVSLEKANEVTSSPNKTFVQQLISSKISFNWLIIGVCVTFSVTCLCALSVCCVVMVTNKQKFNPDEWWNNMAGVEEEDGWLRSQYDEGESGDRRLSSLYSLQGDTLKKEVSRMIDDFGSASSCTSVSK
ncbi:hypothetical protein EB796_006173 [Bugula neritina]|uniref:Uncharacterized protein n=1 Tax=Bugula neritina TaxID=10212 RepID=A0A7J7KDA4_BUGNE|nr:hypothetical protein EB796_006173 [Bugula neritina]